MEHVLSEICSTSSSALNARAEGQFGSRDASRASARFSSREKDAIRPPEHVVDGHPALGRKLLLVFGPPGTGKTTRLLDLLASELEAGTPADRIAFVTFTKAARAEAKGRVLAELGVTEDDLPWFRTVHSAAYRLLGLRGRQVMGVARWVEFATRHGYDLTNLAHADQDDDPLTPPKRTPDDLLRAVVEWAKNRRLALDEALGCCPLNVPAGDARLFAQRLAAFQEEHGLLGFSDMLEEVVTRGLRPDVCVAFIDEAQDLSPLQIAVVETWFCNCERVYVGGDDDQCQPPATVVETPNGQCRLGDLRDGDLVNSWDRKDLELRRCGRSVRVARRQHEGPLIRVTTAAGFQTLATPDHRFVVRWADRNTATFVVYLMYRPDLGYRVGWCQLFNSEGALHLNARMRLERARAAWILSVHATKQDASARESIIAARFGVPTAMFEPNHLARLYTRETLSRIFAAVDRSHGERCLRDHGLDPRLPFWPPPDRIDRQRLGRATIFESHAANLTCGLLAVPTVAGIWSRVLRAEQVPYVGEVVSLAVERDHTYVADGIVTHNCIFNFQGAEPSWLLSLNARSTAVEILRQSFRVPGRVHAFARRIISQNRVRVAKPYEPREDAGEVTVLRPEEVLDAVGDAASVFVLVRNRVFLKAWAERLLQAAEAFASDRRAALSPLDNDKVRRALAAGVRLREGKPVGARDLEALLEFIPSRGAGLLPHGVKKRVERAEGEISRKELAGAWGLGHLLAILDVKGPAHVLLRLPSKDRDYLERLLARHGGRVPEPRFRLLTIHGAKGREADVVVVIPDMTRASFSEYIQGGPDGEEAENRVAYVAVTRARKRLILVEPTTRRFYPYERLLRDVPTTPSP